MNVISYML